MVGKAWEYMGTDPGDHRTTIHYMTAHGTRIVRKQRHGKRPCFSVEFVGFRRLEDAIAACKLILEGKVHTIPELRAWRSRMETDLALSARYERKSTWT